MDWFFFRCCCFFVFLCFDGVLVGSNERQNQQRLLLHPNRSRLHQPHHSHNHSQPQPLPLSQQPLHHNPLQPLPPNLLPLPQRVVAYQCLVVLLHRPKQQQQLNRLLRLLQRSLKRRPNLRTNSNRKWLVEAVARHLHVASRPLRLRKR